MIEQIEKDKQLKKTIKEIINGINNLFDKNLGKKASLIRNKKDMIDYTLSEIKSTDLYKEFGLEIHILLKRIFLMHTMVFLLGLNMQTIKIQPMGK
jgi:hypothetical protein